MAKQLTAPSTVTKLPKLADIILRNMDTDLTNGEILWFAKEAMELDMSTSLNMFVLPGAAQYVSGLSYYLPNETEILEIVNEYFNPYATPISSLNVVDVNTIVQKEKARQETLTAEQKRKEEALKEQLENEASSGENELLTEEPEQTDTNSWDPSGTVTDPNGEGQTSTDTTPGDNGQTGEPSNQQPAENQGAVVPEQPVDNGNTDSGQQPAEPTQPGAIPGEVLKSDVDSQPVANDQSVMPDGV